MWLAIAGQPAHIPRPVGRTCCLAALAVIANVVAARPVRAEVSVAQRRIAVVSVGACPSRPAVISAITGAVPDVAIVDDTAPTVAGVEGVVVVSDGSASYRAMVGGVMRTLIDATANCEERARKVAIVVALSVQPPAVAAPDRTEAASAPRSGIAVRLEAGGLAEYGWRRGTARWASSSQARLSLERGGLGLVIGSALVSWSAFEQTVLVQRIPIDVAVRLRHRWSPLAAAIDAGPSLVAQRTRGIDNHHRSVRLEADLRLSARLEVWVRPTYGMFAAVTGTYVPSPASAFLSERDAAYPEMPSWWVSGSAGLIIQIP